MTTVPTGLSRSDRIGMYLTIPLAVIGGIAAIATTVIRLIDVLSGRGISVLVPFAGETAALPIGPDGALIDVGVQQAVVTVDQVAAATRFALVAEPIVSGLTLLSAVVLLCLFCLNVARGRAFSSGNVRVVFIGVAVLLIGWVVGSLFTTMGVNGTLSAVSDYSYDGVLFETNFGPAFGVLALAAVAAAFQVGHRLQRETEGLV